MNSSRTMSVKSHLSVSEHRTCRTTCRGGSGRARSRGRVRRTARTCPGPRRPAWRAAPPGRAQPPPSARPGRAQPPPSAPAGRAQLPPSAPPGRAQPPRPDIRFDFGLSGPMLSNQISDFRVYAIKSHFEIIVQTIKSGFRCYPLGCQIRLRILADQIAFRPAGPSAAAASLDAEGAY